MPATIPPRAARSWWLREALAADPGEPAPALRGREKADVVVVGGGYTGMWSAYFLKERDPSTEVVLLEQDICGGGPSGRNGGFLYGFWDELGLLAEMHGEARAKETCRTAIESVDEIPAWAERHAVDIWYRRGGDLGVASSPAQEGRWRGSVETAQRLGAGDEYVELSSAEVQARCRSPIFGGGIYTPNTAGVQPARLARGLRRVLLERGVRIFENTPVRRFQAGPPATAETPNGVVTAGRAILGVNAWGIAWKRFRRALVVRGSSIVLTAPAPERLEEIGWTGGEGIYDFRAALHYLRTTPDGRIAFGGAARNPRSEASIGPLFAYDPIALRQLVNDLHRMFPPFRDVPIEAGWGGPIDIAAEHLPFFGTMCPGNVHYGLGYTGNGVGPCFLGGRILSGLALEAEDRFTKLAIVDAGPQRFPPQFLKAPGARVVTRATARKDRREDAGKSAGTVTSFLAGLPRKLGYNLGP
ncbi:MAG: NAD(P)/FAD-dependent oxidoreductase [Actinomycetota bacterium]